MSNKPGRIFAVNLQKLLDKKGVTRADLAAATGIPYTTLASWASKYRYPRQEGLEKIANYFGVSIAALVSETPQDETSTSFIRTLFHDDPEILDLLNKAAVNIDGLPYGSEVPEHIKSLLRNALLLAAEEVERIKASK